MCPCCETFAVRRICTEDQREPDNVVIVMECELCHSLWSKQKDESDADGTLIRYRRSAQLEQAAALSG